MGGKLYVLWQPFEVVIICGAALGGFVIANSKVVLTRSAKAVGQAAKGTPYTKQSYLDLLSLLYQILKLAKTKGMIAVEPHVEDPHNSPLFQAFPSVMKNHHAVTFLCDYLRLMSLGTEEPHTLEDLMDEEIETHHHENHTVSSAIQTMADSLPALGIVAAVLGIIKDHGLDHRTARGAGQADRRRAGRHLPRSLAVLRLRRAAGQLDEGDARGRGQVLPVHQGGAAGPSARLCPGGVGRVRGARRSIPMSGRPSTRSRRPPRRCRPPPDARHPPRSGETDMAAGNDRPIIIKKKRQAAGHAHHGGAWKVAYADFVTAMMAFFLLLWLLNVTTDEQRAGIADYFDPANVARATSGAGGILGGATLTSPRQPGQPLARASLHDSRPGRREPVPDAQWHDENSTDEVIPEGATPPPNTAGGGTGSQADGRQGPDDAPRGFALGGDRTGVDGDPTDATGTAEAGADPAGAAGGPATDRQLAEALAEQERQAFEATEAELRQAIQEMPELQELARNLVVEQTPEGLAHPDRRPGTLFHVPAGQRRALRPCRGVDWPLIARVVDRLPNSISITGHTDANPVRRGLGLRQLGTVGRPRQRQPPRPGRRRPRPRAGSRPWSAAPTPTRCSPTTRQPAQPPHLHHPAARSPPSVPGPAVSN